MEREGEPEEERGVEEEEGDQHLGHVHAHVHVDAERRKPARNYLQFQRLYIHRS